MLLQGTLSDCDWPCVLNETSVKSAVHHLAVVALDAVKEAVSFVKTKTYISPHCISESLAYYTKKFKIIYMIINTVFFMLS